MVKRRIGMALLTAVAAALAVAGPALAGISTSPGFH